MIGLCDKYVYRLIREGKIRAFTYNKAYRATKIAVIEYLLDCEQKHRSNAKVNATLSIFLES